MEIHVDSSVAGVRPFVVCGVLRDITFTPMIYKSFIDMQDKLHQTIGKRRALVSIGTHDLDTIQAPFVYKAAPPEEIRFIPLKRTEEMNAKELMELLSTDLKLKEYLDLLRPFPVYPVLYDSKGVVLSLPPIINGEHSKISLKSKNVFVEVTSTDLTKGIIVLETILATFSQYCASPYSCEQVIVISDHEKQKGKNIYPDFENKPKHTAVIEHINNALGLSLSKKEMEAHLRSMSLLPLDQEEEEGKGKEGIIVVATPPLRSDVMHECDLLEDVAIAHGFNNIIPNPYCTRTVGKQLLRTKFTELLSQEVASAGFCEAMTWILCSLKDNYENLCLENDNKSVLIGNTKTSGFQTSRVSLLPGLLHCVANNKTSPCPLKLFECGDVVMKEESHPVGAKNITRIAAVIASVTPNYEQLNGLLDRIMQVCCVYPKFMTKEANKPTYALEQFSSNSPHSLPLYNTAHCLSFLLSPPFFPPFSGGMFLQNSGFSVLVNGKKVGTIGVVHPKVLYNFEVTHPCSVLELDIDPISIYL
jgi:phenylalanyl-tRNA synthetase beta chain